VNVAIKVVQSLASTEVARKFIAVKTIAARSAAIVLTAI